VRLKPPPEKKGSNFLLQHTITVIPKRKTPNKKATTFPPTKKENFGAFLPAKSLFFETKLLKLAILI